MVFLIDQKALCENLLEIKCKTTSELVKETEQVKKAEITKIETIYFIKEFYL
jgi:hypothetical protein